MALTQEQQQQLRQYEIQQKWKTIRLALSIGGIAGYVYLWTVNVVLGMFATVALGGFIEGMTESKGKSSATIEQEQYYRLRNLQILDDE